MDDEVFSLAWSPTLVALSYLLDKVVDDSLLTQKLMTGYRKCATIAAHYGRTEVFDHLIQALYKYTGQYYLNTVNFLIDENVAQCHAQHFDMFDELHRRKKQSLVT